MRQIKNIQEELKNKHFRVSIFGSARIKEDRPGYNQVYKLAKLIGARGIDVVTGGGPGIMEAASRGHRDGRGNKKTETIGLAIDLVKGQETNKSIDVEKRFKRFSKRLDRFMLLSNVVIVAPGGVGTLLEFFYAWQLVQVKHICDMPIILLGEMWPGLISWLEKSPLKKKFFSEEDLTSLFYAKDYKEAIKMIDKAYEEYKKGNKDFCLNYKKYKLY